MTTFQIRLASIFILAGAAGCSDPVTDTGEVAQSAGEALASLDEVTSGGGFAHLLPMYRAPAHLSPSIWERATDLFVAPAYGAACSTVTFDACSSGERLKTWGGCTIGRATLTGTVRLQFSRNLCQVITNGDTVTRRPDFTIAGTRGATLTVSTSGTGGGQVLTKTATGYSFSVSGLDRAATRPDGGELFHIQTETTSPLTITGTSRANRVINGGTLRITHHIADFMTDLTPSNVTWTAGCNCPTSGMFSGTLSGSRTGTFTIEFTGCGTATVTTGSASETVELDRCFAG
ncbi:MAG: hypothetical protein ACKVPX_14345 [Myxococcaceae bacterium]